MGRKIFISYKYGDTNVQPLKGLYITKARDYVTELQNHIDREDHINKGEEDGQSLQQFKDEYIESSLKDKIYDSSLTVVFISKRMKNPVEYEADQWMPWEIAYSLKEISRNGRISTTNAMLAVVLPDEQGSYEYYIEEGTCPYCNCRILKTDTLFQILRDNMFNQKKPNYSNCNNHPYNRPLIGYSSYIYTVKWDNFINNVNHFFNIAYEIKNNLNGYNLVKTVKDLI